MDELLHDTGALHFDIRGAGDFEIRGVVLRADPEAKTRLIGVRAILAMAVAEGLKNVPDLRMNPNGNGYGVHMVLPRKFFDEMLEHSRAIMTMAKSKRNAQLSVSVFDAATAAGCESLHAVHDVDKILGLLRTGVSPASGPFAGRRFQLPLTDIEAKEAQRWLRMGKVGLEYTPPSGEGPAVVGTKRGMIFELVGDLLSVLKPSAFVQKIRRNAQNVCSAYAAGSAAGSKELISARSIRDILSILARGTRGSGNFSTSTFQVGPFTANEVTLMERYLKLDSNGLMTFDDHGEAELLDRVSARLDPERTARRDAQNLASAYAAACAAGATELEKLRDLDAIIRAMNTGVNGGGNFTGSLFQVKLDAARAAAAKQFLKLEDDSLTYLPTDG
jgi:hypothetical protein